MVTVSEESGTHLNAGKRYFSGCLWVFTLTESMFPTHGMSQWYDRVYSRALTRIEETLTELKQLQANEGQEGASEGLEENLAQQVELTEKLAGYAQIAHTTAQIRQHPNAVTEIEKTYTFSYSAESTSEAAE